MKKRVIAVVLIFIFVFTSTIGIYAKGARSFGGSRSFSKSFSSKSFSTKSYSSKSGGLFGSSKSKTGSLFGSSKSKSSSSRSIPGGNSYSGNTKSSTAAKGFSSKASSKKYSYMQDSYKKQVSGKNFNTYKQKLNAQQQKVYNDTIKRDYGVGSRRMNFENAMNTRTSRVNTFSRRPVFMNVNTGIFSSPFSYGYAYVGAWDLWFLMRASEMFWFHHWYEISPYKSYFNQQEYEKLEKRVGELEKQGVQRDPNYMDPDVDPDLQLSQQYQEQNIDKVYYTEKYPAGTGATAAVVLIVVVSVTLVIVIKKVSKPKRKKSHYSRIY